MGMTLQAKAGGDFKPHPEGIHHCVCVDVIDLGLVETSFQGVTKLVNKLKVIFESQARMEDGRPFTVGKNFTASLHKKAKLNEFLGKWRGRPVVVGETIDLDKLIGSCCTLVISHQENQSGNLYAQIDAVSKPTETVKASGTYDGAAVRKAIAEWSAKRAAGLGGSERAVGAPAPMGSKVRALATASSSHEPEPPEEDPEVGF